MRSLSRTLAAALTALALLATTSVTSASASVPPPVSTSNIPCTKLASAVNPTASFATAVSLRNPAIQETLGMAQQLLPSTDVIRAAGGVVCEWSNGRPFTGVPGGAFVGVRVEFLHAASDGYWRWAGVFAPVTTPEVTTCSPGFCQFMSSAGDDWLMVSVYGARSEPVAISLGERIRTALQLGSESTWAPVASAHPLGHSCEEVIPRDAFRAAIGTTTPLFYFPDPPGWSILHEALHRVPAPMCSLLTADGSAGPGWFRTLPSGSWGFDEVAPYLTAPGPMLPFTRVSLPAGDRAYVRCNSARTDCILDAIIAEHWVQVQLWPEGKPRTIAKPRLDALADILRSIVYEIYT
jgi:hypothetical protein